MYNVIIRSHKPDGVPGDRLMRTPGEFRKLCWPTRLTGTVLKRAVNNSFLLTVSFLFAATF